MQMQHALEELHDRFDLQNADVDPATAGDGLTLNTRVPKPH
jgi:hypothetical protein